VEKTSGPERIVAAPSQNHVALMIELMQSIPEPFGVLYVLVVPRGEVSAARYQCASPKSVQETAGFLTRFNEFFENDGRHDVWVASLSSSDLLVYDRHNVIYGYGQIAAYQEVLNRRGFSQTDAVRFPVPHVHKYNAIFDSEQNALLRYWEWEKRPLREQDE
jgi:hypothetical protein